MNWITTLYYECDKIRDFMYDYLDGKLPPFVAFRFRMHLKNCPDCREYLALYRSAANTKEFRTEHPVPDECLKHTLEFLRKKQALPPK